MKRGVLFIFLVFVLFSSFASARDSQLVTYDYFFGRVDGFGSRTLVVAKVGGQEFAVPIVDDQYGYDPVLVVRGSPGDKVSFFVGSVFAGDQVLEGEQFVRFDLFGPDSVSRPVSDLPVSKPDFAQPRSTSLSSSSSSAASSDSLSQSSVQTYSLVAEEGGSWFGVVIIGVLSILALVVLFFLVRLVYLRRLSRPDPRLKSYVQSMLSQGYSEEQIVSSLRQQGWDEDKIRRSL